MDKRWSIVFIKIVAAVLGFVSFVGAIEWFTVRQYDWDIWLLSHQAETRFEEQAETRFEEQAGRE